MELTNNTKEILKSINYLTQSILATYDKIIFLDKTDSEEYQSLIQNLAQDISLSQSLYPSLGNNPEELQAILQYLNCYQTLKTPTQDIDAASFKKDDLVNYRIAKTIAHTFLSNPKVQLKKYAYLGSNAFEVIGYCNQDIINTLLGIINKTLNDKDEESKKYLKTFMYHLIFLNPEVEEEMLKNNFQLNEKITWQAKMYGSLKGIDEKIIKIERSDISSEIFMKSLKFILNHYYDITNCKKEFELMATLFRGSILFFDSDELNQYLNIINQKCFENISDPNSLKLQVIIKDLSSHIIEDKSDIEEFSLNFKK